MPWWCSTVETLKATWRRSFSTKTSTWERNTSSTFAALQRKCTTTPGGHYTTRALLTCCLAPAAGNVRLHHAPQAGTKTRTRGRTAAVVTRADSCRSDCRSSKKLCCACCAVRRRLTLHSAPVAIWCAARTVPISFRWVLTRRLIYCCLLQVRLKKLGITNYF